MILYNKHINSILSHHNFIMINYFYTSHNNLKDLQCCFPHQRFDKASVCRNKIQNPTFCHETLYSAGSN